MIKIYDEPVKINKNPTWIYIPGHLHRILIIAQPAHDVPRTFPEGLLKVLTSGTSRNLQRTLRRPTQKVLIKWKKGFIDEIVLYFHIYYCVLLEKEIFKSSKWERPREVYGTYLRDVPRAKLWNALGTSTRVRSYMFWNSTQKHIKLTLTGYSRLYSES